MKITLPIIAVTFTLLSLVLVAEAGKKRGEFHYKVEDPCNNGTCADGSRIRTSEPWTDTPCGPIAVWHIMDKMCRSTLNRVSPVLTTSPMKSGIKIIDQLVKDWVGEEQNFGMPPQWMEDALNDSFHNNLKCPNGIWHLFKERSAAYIDSLRLVTRGESSVAAALVQMSTVKANFSKLHWYMVEEVTGSGRDCRVYVKDAEGRGYYSCGDFVQMARLVPSFPRIMGPNTIVWFEPK